MMISKKNLKFKDFNSWPKILVYLQNNVIILFEVWKNTKSKNPRVAKIERGKAMLLSKCAVCDSKKQVLLAVDKIMSEMH